MDRDKLFRRTRDLLRPEVARRQTFLVIGAGSGGARLAEEAVRFGIGRLVLIDRPGERLEEHNIIRHPLGYSALGQEKTLALRRRLLDINPDCRIACIALDVRGGPDPLPGLVARADQVHLCTDNEASKHAVNQLTVRAGVPLIFAGVFDGGCGGEVGRAMPGQACYACMAAHLERSAAPDDRAETFDYSRPDELEFPSTAALNVDIAQIALIQARVALLTMLGDPEHELAGNYILFANRRVPGLFPQMLHSEWWNIPRQPGCMVCAPRPVGVEAQAADLLAAAAARPAAPVDQVPPGRREALPCSES